MFIFVLSRIQMLSPSNKRFEFNGISFSLTTVHAPAIKAAKLFIPLPSPTLLILTTRHHTLLRTPTRNLLHVAQSKTLSNLLIRIPRLFATCTGSQIFLINSLVFVSVRFDILALPSMRRMIGTPCRRTILFLSESYIFPLEAFDVLTVLPGDAVGVGAAGGGACGESGGFFVGF